MFTYIQFIGTKNITMTHTSHRGPIFFSFEALNALCLTTYTVINNHSSNELRNHARYSHEPYNFIILIGFKCRILQRREINFVEKIPSIDLYHITNQLFYLLSWKTMIKQYQIYMQRFDQTIFMLVYRMII